MPHAKKMSKGPGDPPSNNGKSKKDTHPSDNPQYGSHTGKNFGMGRSDSRVKKAQRMEIANREQAKGYTKQEAKKIKSLYTGGMSLGDARRQVYRNNYKNKGKATAMQKDKK